MFLYRIPGSIYLCFVKKSKVSIQCDPKNVKNIIWFIRSAETLSQASDPGTIKIPAFPI